MNTPKRAFVDVDGEGRLKCGQIMARNDKRNLIYVVIDDDPTLDNWYNKKNVSELA